MGIGITAVGGYVPARIMPNAEFEALLETSDEWIVARTGIRERRIAAANETASSMGVRAVQDLLEQRPDALEGVDLVICATSTADAIFPSTAALIALGVGLTSVAAFDISAACAGFGHALGVAYGLLSSGVHQKALVLGSETMSRTLDWTDRSTAILFGDGAGVVLLEGVPDPYGILGVTLGGDAKGGQSLYLMNDAPTLPGVEGALEHPNAKLTQNGREVFKFAVRIVPSATLEVLQKAGLGIEDLDFLIPHQANVRILESACERLNFPMSKVALTLDRFGNTSAASIPLALKESLEQLRDGDNVVMVGFGGGLAWSAVAMKWYKGSGEFQV